MLITATCSEGEKQITQLEGMLKQENEKITDLASYLDAIKKDDIALKKMDEKLRATLPLDKIERLKDLYDQVAMFTQRY